MDATISDEEVVEYASAWAMVHVEFRRADLMKALTQEYPALAPRAETTVRRVIERLRRDGHLTQLSGAVWYWNGPQEAQ